MALKRAIGGSTRSLGARPPEEHTGGPLDERSVCRRYSITSCTTSAADAENVAESGLSKTRRRKYRPRTNASNVSALTTGRRRRRTRRRRREICVIKLKRTILYPTAPLPSRVNYPISIFLNRCLDRDRRSTWPDRVPRAGGADLKPRILSTRRRGRGAAPSAGAALASDSYTQLVVQYVYVYVYCSTKVLSYFRTKVPSGTV